MTTATDIEHEQKDVVKLQPPSMYKVILHNDDTTTVDFVILVLLQIFHRSVEDAVNITHIVHNNQQAIAGAPYTKEIAEEKTNETKLFARANNYPLVATFEEL